MIFFTRELHEGYQDDSGWTRSATVKYSRNFKLYRKYFRLIRPFLPLSAIRFSKFGFHDSEVVARDWKDQKLRLILDTAGAISLTPALSRITFAGVRACPSQLPRKKEWWHSGEFSPGQPLQVLLTWDVHKNGSRNPCR